MIKTIKRAFLVLIGLSLITGGLYPLVVTLGSQLIFPAQANGSLVRQGAMVVGSSLIGQANHDPRYFWPRPSAVAYNPLPSGASNLSLTSATLAATVAERADAFRTSNSLPPSANLPADILMASGSGLDPHISPAAARLQVDRVARARHGDSAKIAMLVEQFVERPQLGFLGQPRVNVLLLNMALDQLQ